MKKKYRVENWASYNNSLKKRGSLTIWIEKGFEKSWHAPILCNRLKGRPIKYSDKCINLMITVRHLFKLPLRQTEGFVKSIFTLLKLALQVPEFSRLSKRMKSSLPSIKKDFNNSSFNESTYLIIDSSRLKVYGEQEWLETKYGKCYFRKVWRKLHIGIDESGYILASKLTNHKTDDRSVFADIVASAETAVVINEVLADRGYDIHDIYNQCRFKNIKVLIPPPSNAVIDQKRGCAYVRNETIEYINEKGIHAWYNKNNFGRRNRVENTFYRIKTDLQFTE